MRLVAEPVRSGGTEATISAGIAAKEQPTPTPSSAVAIATSNSLSWATASHSSVAATISAPTGNTTRIPYLAITRRVIGCETRLPIDSGSSIRPVVTSVAPKP